MWRLRHIVRRHVGDALGLLGLVRRPDCQTRVLAERLEDRGVRCAIESSVVLRSTGRRGRAGWK